MFGLIKMTKKKLDHKSIIIRICHVELVETPLKQVFGLSFDRLRMTFHLNDTASSVFKLPLIL